MRITSKTGGYITDPCGFFAEGETEDYCIQITNGILEVKDTKISPRAYGNTAIELSESVNIVSNNVELATKVFPNPVSHTLNVTLSTTENVASVNLYDMLGNRVYNTEDIDTEMRINVTGLPVGSYLVEVRQSDGQSTTDRIIVTR